MADFKQKFDEFTNTPDSTSEMEQQDIENNKLMGILAYISWLVLIPIFCAKDSKFARYHCNQGLVLAIAELIVGIVLSILGGIPVIGIVFRIISALFYLVCVGYVVIGALNVANGKARELPIIGKFRILK